MLIVGIVLCVLVVYVYYRSAKYLINYRVNEGGDE